MNGVTMGAVATPANRKYGSIVGKRGFTWKWRISEPATCWKRAFANGKIVIPKNRVDRHLAEGLRDARKGKTHGPYATVAAAIRALERRARRPAKQRRSSEH
jgi:hypothetical protein